MSYSIDSPVMQEVMLLILKYKYSGGNYVDCVRSIMKLLNQHNEKAV